MSQGIGFPQEVASAMRPESLGTLRAWYDASSEVFSDGDAVATFSDQGTNNYDLLQATGANKPLYRLNVANGLPALEFVSSDYLATASFGATTQPMTIYVVAKRTGDTSSARVLVDGIGVSNRLVISSAVTTGLPGSFAGSQISGFEDLGSDWFVATAVFNGASSKLLINDVLVATGNVGAQTLTGITMGIAYDGSTAPWVGYIAEALYFDGAVTTDNDSVIRRFLHAKYKIGYFEPSSISGLRSVFDASGIQGLKDGDAVSEWLDTYGTYHLLQATGTNQPLYMKDIQNHRPVVRFDGSDNFMRSASFTALASQCTIFIVGKHDDAGATEVWFDGIGGSNRHAITSTITSGFLNMTAGTLLSSTTDIGTSFAVVSAVFNAGSSALYKNGTSIASGAAGSHVLTGYTLGAAYDNSAPFDGDIGKVLIYEGALSTVNRQRVEGYLRTDWAI